MPELPEVETIARGLQHLVGQRIESVRLGPHDWVRAPGAGAAAHLRGRTIAAVGRHGKQLRFALEPGGCLVVHLGMSGVVTAPPAAETVAPHTHLILGFAGFPAELRIRDPRRFGGAWVQAENGAWPAESPAALGPDALAVSAEDFQQLLKRPRQLKSLLLDQQSIAGIGNIYCDEALHAARLHPLASSAAISAARARELHGHLLRILASAIGRGGSTLRDYRNAEGDPGGFQEDHRVYGREGRPCPRCGAKIARILAAGRSTHLCRRCQRAPRARSSSRAAGSRRSRNGIRGRRSRPRPSP